jgi:hypothetical protein
MVTVCPTWNLWEATERSNVVTAWLYQSSRVSGISHIQQDQATIDTHESSFRGGQATFMLPSTTVGTKDFDMKPEWMSLPKDKRQSEEQAKPFAKKAMERIPSSADPYRQIMRWLLPRIGKP